MPSCNCCLISFGVILVYRQLSVCGYQLVGGVRDMDPGRWYSGNHTDISVITMPPGTPITGSLQPPPCSGRVNSHAWAPTFLRIGVAPHPSLDTPIQPLFAEAPKTKLPLCQKSCVSCVQSCTAAKPSRGYTAVSSTLVTPPSALASLPMRRNGGNTPLHSAVSHTVTWTPVELRPWVSQKIVPIAAT